MSKRIITISREFGSGGRTIGKMVAEKLGIAFYDKELIEKIAEETGFPKSLLRNTASMHREPTYFLILFLEGMPMEFPCRIRSGCSRES